MSKRLLALLSILNFGYASTEQVIKISDKEVESVVMSIKRFLSLHHIKLFTTFDHAREAKNIDMPLSPAQVIVFGNPSVGTKLMQDDIRIALDLPLKMLVWQEGNDSYIAYRSVETYASQSLQKKHEEILLNMDGMMKKIVNFVKHESV